MSWFNDRAVLIKLLVPVVASALALVVGCAVGVGAAGRINTDLDQVLQQVVPGETALGHVQASI